MGLSVAAEISVTHTNPFHSPLLGLPGWAGTRTNLVFTEARLAVASAGPYANLHLTPD